MNVELVWVLDQTYHDLPDDGSVFEFSAPRFSRPTLSGIPSTIQPTDKPSRVVADSDAGIRLSTFWKGWDLTLHYFFHYDDTPVFRQSISTTGGGPSVTITPEYHRTHLVATTFSNAFGDLTLRGEVAAFLGRSFSVVDPTDTDGLVQSDELTYVIGLDWHGVAETLISFQLFQSQMTDAERGSLRDRTETNTTLLVRHEMLNDTLVMETMWLHSVNQGDGLIRPKITYHLDDHTILWLGADLFYGGQGGLFGQFDASDRLIMGVRWGF